MSYLSLEEYPRKWIFSHHSMPVSSQDLAKIKPMTQARSAQVWIASISKLSPDSERFAKTDWPSHSKNWSAEIDWMEQWESDDESLPEEVLQHIEWQDDIVLYFCYDKYNVIETQWAVFKRNWKNFLFFSDGPILFAKKRNQALWFSESGTVKLGVKAAVE